MRNSDSPEHKALPTEGNPMQDLGKLLLRLMVGGLMLPHGIAKLGNFQGTIDFMSGLLAKNGLPEFLSYGVIVGEVLGPVLVILGVKARLSALTIAGTMVFAVYLAHMGDFAQLTKHGGWMLELQAFFFFGSVIITLLGSGRFALMKD